jgi:lipopolysaccharide biosynthesis glycosyltransferase
MSVIRDGIVSNRRVKDILASSNESVRIMGVDYFNAGVALIDCDMWTNLKYPQKWPMILKDYKIRGFEFADQCVLNFLCQQKVNYLPGRYNTLASVKKNRKDSNPYILHFAGGVKPWFYAVSDPRILIGIISPNYVYKYLRYQSQLIESIFCKDASLGLFLVDERKKIRRKFRHSRIVYLKDRIWRFLRSKKKAQKIRQKLTL